MYMHEETDECYGDPRRCHRHGFRTSSADGLHDSPCPGCEAEMDGRDSSDEEIAFNAVHALCAAFSRPATVKTFDAESDEIWF